MMLGDSFYADLEETEVSFLSNFNYSFRSKYQHVQIVETVDHGRLLVLDGLVQLAESDREAYTHGIMDIPNVRSNLHLQSLGIQ